MSCSACSAAPSAASTVCTQCAQRTSGRVERRLVHTYSSRLLDALAAVAPFELAVGHNGRVWIRSDAAATAVLAQLAILRSQAVADDGHAALVESLAHAHA